MSCNVHVGNTVQITLTIVDCSNVAIDVSSATTKEIIAKGGIVRVAKAASFVTDGTDGQIIATFDAGEIDTAGQWRVQGRVVLSGAPDIEYTSEIETFQVDSNL